MTDKILIVEDDDLQAQMVSLIVERHFGYKTKRACHGREALDILNSAPAGSYSLVIMDLGMPVMDGQETLEILNKTHKHLPVIMLTGNKDIKQAVQAMKAGAADFITKPYDHDRMVITIRNTLRYSTLHQEVTRLKKEQDGTIDFDTLIGHDNGLRDYVALGKKIASSDIPALITGPTGTGKEVFSKAIHGESVRAAKPFIAVNCGAIPEKLVESTLFGHEKGAFTGATEKKPGKFKEANGGTIFLDEVGELPLDAQVKLLRVLQQGEVETVGASKATPIDVRIISATNRDLAEEVATGRFREDLYFRLNVLHVSLPSLKNRREDILPLARHFIDRFCAHYGTVPLPLSTEAEQKLTAYDWPGNVRELENAINRALVLCEDDALKPEDFKLQTPRKIDAQTTAENDEENSSYLARDAKITSSGKSTHGFFNKDGKMKTIDEIEAEAMNLALKQHDGNITQAAKALGMAKSTFYRKLPAETS